MEELKYIHVNQHIIKSNLKHNKNDPVFTIKIGRSGKSIKAHSVSTEGQCLFNYSGNGTPFLPCGARVVAATYGVVLIENSEHKSQEIAWHTSQNLVILIINKKIG